MHKSTNTKDNYKAKTPNRGDMLCCFPFSEGKLVSSLIRDDGPARRRRRVLYGMQCNKVDDDQRR
jgi:hypothetical protein